MYENDESDKHSENEIMHSMKYINKERASERSCCLHHLPKCIHKTRNVKYVAHHSSYGCSNEFDCRTYNANKQYGYYLHYRNSFYENANCLDQKTRRCYRLFSNVSKYKLELEKNMKIALNKIFL